MCRLKTVYVPNDEVSMLFALARHIDTSCSYDRYQTLDVVDINTGEILATRTAFECNDDISFFWEFNR